MGVMSELLSQKLIAVQPEWEMPQIADALTLALSGEGPALSFAPTTRTEVSAEIAVVIPTSGSTGEPKEVAYSAAALRASAHAAHQYLHGQPGHRWSLLLPINHIAGVNVLVRALELGTEVMDLRNSDHYSSADFTSVVPTQLHRALNGENDLLNHLRSAKKVLVGGAATDAALLSRARAEGVDVVTTYGMSEMSGGCVYDNQPLAGVDVEINIDGLVRLRGAMIASGYLNQPEMWQRATADGWFTTQDIGHITDGKLFINGRADDVIISGGENISLSAIDSLLNNRFSPQQFIAFGAPDAEWGTKLCVASNAPIAREEIRDFLRCELGAFAAPKECLQVDSLPMRGIGKPDRQALTALLLRRQ